MVDADFEASHIASYHIAVRRLGGLGRIYSQSRYVEIGPIAYLEAPLLRYRRCETQLSHGTAGGKIPLEKVRREDPAMFASHRDLFKHRPAVQFIDATDLTGSSNRIKALELLMKGLRQKVLFVAALRALGLIVIPQSIVSATKQAWRNLTAFLL